MKPKRKAFTVVYHGRLGRFYDLDTYLEIIKIVYKADSSIRFLMVGELPSSISSNASPNLEILPAMKLEKLAKVLASCHLGICLLRELPSMKSAFPAKAYDYIGAGIPVLAGPKGELTQVVNHFNIGITFEKISAKEVADIILGLKNDDIWFKMCAHVKKCRQNFGRRNISREFFSHGFLINNMNRKEHWNLSKVSKLLIFQLFAMGACLGVVFFSSPQSETLLLVSKERLLIYSILYGISCLFAGEIIGLFANNHRNLIWKKCLLSLVSTSMGSLGLILAVWTIEFEFVGRFAILKMVLLTGLSGFFFLAFINLLNQGNPWKVLAHLSEKDAKKNSYQF